MSLYTTVNLYNEIELTWNYGYDKALKYLTEMVKPLENDEVKEIGIFKYEGFHDSLEKKIYQYKDKKFIFGDNSYEGMGFTDYDYYLIDIDTDTQYSCKFTNDEIDFEIENFIKETYGKIKGGSTIWR